MILWKCELVGIPSLRRSYSSEYCATLLKLGMTGLCLSYVFLYLSNGLAIVSRCNCRDSSRKRTGFLDALGLHVLQKLGPYFGFFDQIKDSLGLDLVYCPSSSVVIIPDNYNVEDVAGDVAAEERIGAPYCLHVRLATRDIWGRRHKGILIMAARQVLETAADQEDAALLRFVGIGEIHLLFRQERTQMFVDLLQWGVFECLIGALLGISLLDFV